MKNENNLVIQKAYKGNTIAILDKDFYLKSVETLLKDCSTFKNIPIAPNKDLNYIIKFLVPVLSDITQNEFTVKDSFTIVDEILTHNSDLYMASLDIDALFTNIPLDETIDFCSQKIF